MIRSSRFTCVLDTCVIYLIEIRDSLLWFAHYGLFIPRWTSDIVNEWDRVMQRKGISEIERRKRTSRINLAFPYALVTEYEKLIDSLELPDINDRHVLAAAIKVNANVIVTNNIKDFPEEYLLNFGLTVKTADDFLADVIDLDHHKSIAAFQELVMHRRNPDLDEYQVLAAMRRNGLIKTSDYLHALL